MPEGPCELWMLLLCDRRELLGARLIEGPPEWLWRTGKLCVGYGPVTVHAQRRGRLGGALIAAVNRDAGAWAALFGVGVGNAAGTMLRPGAAVHITDGAISLTPTEGPWR